MGRRGGNGGENVTQMRVPKTAEGGKTASWGPESSTTINPARGLQQRPEGRLWVRQNR